jgi:hypothetical protein
MNRRVCLVMRAAGIILILAGALGALILYL